MRKLMQVAVGALAAAGFLLAGCEEQNREMQPGQGGSGFEQQQETQPQDPTLGEDQGVMEEQQPLPEQQPGQGGAGDIYGEEPMEDPAMQEPTTPQEDMGTMGQDPETMQQPDPMEEPQVNPEQGADQEQDVQQDPQMNP